MINFAEKWRKIRLFAGVVRYLSIALYLVFILCNLVLGRGILWLNVFLLAVTAAYLLLCIWETHGRRTDGQRMAKAVGKPLYRMLRYIAKIFAVFIPVLSLVSAIEYTGFLSVFLSVLLFIFLFLQLLVDAIVLIFAYSAEKLRSSAMKKWNSLRKKKTEKAIGVEDVQAKE